MDLYKVRVSRTGKPTFTVDHSLEEALENFRKTVFDFGSSFNQVMTSLSEVFRSAGVISLKLTEGIIFKVEPIIAQLKEEESIRQKGLELGLVSNRVIELSRRPGKTGKKNMNRIRKELRKYGKRL